MKLRIVAILSIFLVQVDVAARSIHDLSHGELLTTPEGEMRLNEQEMSLDLSGLDLNSLDGLQDAGLLDEVYGNDVMQTVTTLSLRHNLLNTLIEGTFDQFTGLVRLDLSDNELVIVPEKIFYKLTKLKILSLASNQLSALPLKILDNLSKLRALFLVDNEFKELPTALFDVLAPRSYVALDGNPLSPAEQTKLVDYFNNKGIHTDLRYPATSSSRGMRMSKNKFKPDQETTHVAQKSVSKKKYDANTGKHAKKEKTVA